MKPCKRASPAIPCTLRDCGGLQCSNADAGCSHKRRSHKRCNTTSARYCLRVPHPESKTQTCHNFALLRSLHV